MLGTSGCGELVDQMMGRGNLRSIAACAAGAGLIGCGGSHSPKLTTAAHGSRSPSPASGRGSQPAGALIVSIPNLGSLSYRCAGARLVEATLDTRNAGATEYATVEGDNRLHLRAKTLNNPGPFELTAPPANYRTLTWRVIQSTEPHTLEATVRLSFYWGHNLDCTLKSWSSVVNVIGHQGKWLLPRAWP